MRSRISKLPSSDSIKVALQRLLTSLQSLSVAQRPQHVVMDLNEGAIRKTAASCAASHNGSASPLSRSSRGCCSAARAASAGAACVGAGVRGVRADVGQPMAGHKHGVSCSEPGVVRVGELALLHQRRWQADMPRIADARLLPSGIEEIDAVVSTLSGGRESQQADSQVSGVGWAPKRLGARRLGAKRQQTLQVSALRQHRRGRAGTVSVASSGFCCQCAPVRACCLPLPWVPLAAPACCLPYNACVPSTVVWPTHGSRGNINIIEAAVKKGVKKFVLVTSLGCGDTKDAIGDVYNVLKPWLRRQRRCSRCVCGRAREGRKGGRQGRHDAAGSRVVGCQLGAGWCAAADTREEASGARAVRTREDARGAHARPASWGSAARLRSAWRRAAAARRC